MIHREEFVYLPHVEHDRALIAWGAFFFEPDGDRLKLIDHEDLAKLPEPRARGCIGRESDGYGPAVVRVSRLAAGDARADTREVPVPAGQNHAWVDGLQPDTRYEYEVLVRGQPWGGAPSDFSTRERKGRFTPAAWRYENRFTTFPSPDGPPGPVTFAVLGDPGTGKDAQYEIADRLEALLGPERVRYVLTTGDNVYAQVKNKGVLGLLEKGIRVLTKNLRDSGNEDDDWFDTYFHSYRRIINRVPVFPALGNHDHVESENAADLDQQVDNFYLDERFPAFAQRWKDAEGRFRTMFYRFRCGPDLEMAAIDTGEPSTDPAFERPQQKPFIDDLLKHDTRGWRIPFSHHPPYSIGPNHVHEPHVQNLANLFTGLDSFRLWISGHEHNFQHHVIGDLPIHYIVSGASGKQDDGVDRMRVHPGTSCCHGADLHFLLVTVDGPRLTLRAIGKNGQPIPRKPLSDIPPHGPEITITL